MSFSNCNATARHGLCVRSCCQIRHCIDGCECQLAGPDLTRPDVLKVVDTLSQVFKLLERLSERERELQLWEREGGQQACTVIAGVLFHALDIVHASVLVTPQTQRVRLADGISRQLARIEHGLGRVLSGMPEDELSMLTKSLLEIEHFELVRASSDTILVRAWKQSVIAVLTEDSFVCSGVRRWKRRLQQSWPGYRSWWMHWTGPGKPTILSRAFRNCGRHLHLPAVRRSNTIGTRCRWSQQNLQLTHTPNRRQSHCKRIMGRLIPGPRWRRHEPRSQQQRPRPRR